MKLFIAKSPLGQKLSNYYLCIFIPTRYYDRKEKDKIKILLNKARYLFESYKIISLIPKELLTRNLMKQAVMTYGYSAGDKARIEQFTNYIKEYYISLGVAVLPLTDTEIKSISLLLNQKFDIIAKEHLKAIAQFMDISRKSLKISTRVVYKYLEWTFRVLQKKQSRHNIKTTHGNHKFSIYHDFGITREGMEITFKSIFIQGLDAHITHELVYI